MPVVVGSCHRRGRHCHRICGRLERGPLSAGVTGVVVSDASGNDSGADQVLLIARRGVTIDDVVMNSDGGNITIASGSDTGGSQAGDSLGHQRQRFSH